MNMAEELPRPTKTDKNGDTEHESPLRKRVCFICGSQTTLIINIHEPRNGPNIVDVISEKFKTRPLSDDRFLCYSCNNWLINWYSLQSRVGGAKDANEAAATTTTTSNSESGSSKNGHGSRSPRHRHQLSRPMLNNKVNENDDYYLYHDEGNDLTVTVAHTTNTVMLSAAPKQTYDTVMEHECGAEAVEISNVGKANVDPYLTSAIHAARSKLRKYLYYPHEIRRCRKLSVSDKSVVCDSDGVADWAHLTTACYLLDDVDRDQKMCDLENGQRQGQRRRLRRRRTQHHRRGQYSSFRCTYCGRSIRTRGPAIKSLTVARSCQRCKMSMYTLMRRGSRQSPEPNAATKQTPLPTTSSIVSYNNSPIFIDDDPPVMSSFTGSTVAPSSCLVDKLRMLGTTLSYESDQCHRQQTASWLMPSACISEREAIATSSHVVAPPTTSTCLEDNNEGDTESVECIATTSDLNATDHPRHNNQWQNTNNEIVLTFNTVVTEVFPIELFRKDGDRCTVAVENESRRARPSVALERVTVDQTPHALYQPQLSMPQINDIDSDHMQNDDGVDSADEEVAAFNTSAAARMAEYKRIKDIMKYIPKSLTITLT